MFCRRLEVNQVNYEKGWGEVVYQWNVTIDNISQSHYALDMFNIESYTNVVY